MSDKLATATHEAAHLVASAHFGFAVGERGVSIQWDGQEYTGFTDINYAEIIGHDLTSPENEYERTQYTVIHIAGPLCQLEYHRTSKPCATEAALAEAILLVAAGGRDDFNTVMFHPDPDNENGFKYGKFCCVLYLCSELSQPPSASSDLRGRTMADVNIVRQLIHAYQSEISTFARVLNHSMHLSQEQVNAWLHDNFVRKALT
jgi:hypothetical protein